MRLFDFQCPECDYQFEELVPNGETGDSVTCPNCEHKGVRKLLGGFALGGSSSSSGGSSFSGGGCGSGGFT